MQNVTLSHLKLFHLEISGKLQQYSTYSFMFYMKVHDSTICETWQLPLWAEQMAVIKTQFREQVDKDISIITLSLHNYTQL